METSQETEEMKKSELQDKEMKNLEEKTKKGQKRDKTCPPSCHDENHRGTMRICFKC
jgi:hypothetical protein